MMSSQPPESTPLPIPTFQKGIDAAGTPAHFLGFLKTMLHKIGRNVSEEEDGPLETRKQNMEALMRALSDPFFGTFATPKELPWAAMHETLKLTEYSLLLVVNLARHIEYSVIFAEAENLSGDLFVRFLRTISVLDGWMDISVPNEPGYPTPEELQNKFIDTCIKLLCSLGSRPKVDIPDTSIPGWKLLSSIVGECLGVCDDLLSHASELSFPIFISLFQTPRIRTASSDKDGIKTIHIRSASQVPLLLSVVVHIVATSTRSNLLSHWFNIHLVRRAIRIARQSFDFIFSPACSTTEARRVRATTRIIAAIASSPSSKFDFSEPAEYLCYQYLMRRLYDGPQPAWRQADIKLLETFQRPFTSDLALSGVRPVVSALCSRQWGDGGEDIRALATAYVSSCLPHVSEDCLRSIQKELRDRPDHLWNLLGVVERMLQPQDSAHSDAEEPPKDEVQSWRDRVRAVVQAIIEPDGVFWMDDDDSTTNEHYISRAVGEVDSRFERPIYDTSESARLELATHLALFPCALAHGVGADCLDTPWSPNIPTIPVCLRVIDCIMDGPTNEVTPPVFKKVYEAISQSIRHHAAEADERMLDHAAEIINVGMKNSDRSVRLSAGRALAELVRLYIRIGDGSPACAEPLFQNLARICEASDQRLVETAMISAGYIGKLAGPEALFQVISCLITHLGYSSLAIRGTAYMQLAALAKHYKKSHYSFLSPHLPKLAQKIVAESVILAEVCRFLSVNQSAFIDVTLGYTLPSFFAECDLQTLERIAQELSNKTSTLFMSYCSTILARVFLLPPGQTNRVLTFITNILREAADDSSIGPSNLVGISTVDLLAELVIVMGEEEDQAVEKATQALLKVESVMETSPTHRRSNPGKGITPLLNHHMLGIHALLSELLQDVRGKKGPDQKKQILRSLGPFVQLVGPGISNIAPQIMATMQSMVTVLELSEVTLTSWYTFLKTLDVRDLGPNVGPTSASLVAYWSTFSYKAQEIAKQCLSYIVVEKGVELADYLNEVADFGTIPQLATINQRLWELRRGWVPTFKLEKLLERSASDSPTVAAQSLGELKSFMASNAAFIGTLCSGDVFDSLVGQILPTLLAAACRDGEGSDVLRNLAFDCIGMLGAVDPDRFELGGGDSNMIMLSNFTDETESVAFALHLITDVLVNTFRSTNDTKYQSHLAFALQELLKYCKFTPSLVNSGSAGGPVPLKVRNRWNSLPKHVVETATPLLGGRYMLKVGEQPVIQHPIYPTQPTYREWIQCWASHLITRTSEKAGTIFKNFVAVVRNKDVGVAHHLLPHLVLNVLVSGGSTDSQNVRLEILAVLEDQVDPASSSTADKKDLSAQAVFMLMDHLNKWLRVMRQEVNAKKTESKRSRANVVFSEAEEQLLKVDSILTSINQSLMAQAALQCKAYGRALMSFEQQILALQSSGAKGDLHSHYERLHEIYSHLDEPDGMEGVSTLILSPSLEHQIRQHESTGKWTSAQSCWEVRLQQSPKDLQSHLGLLRCLRNLGHYDTMRTHVKGVLTGNPDWEPDLIGYQIESGWIVGDWDEVQASVINTKAITAPVLLAQTLLAMRERDDTAVSESLARARQVLGTPVIAAGPQGYRRAYDAVLDLHMLHELDLIYQMTSSAIGSSNPNKKLEGLLPQLSTRLNATLPAFRIREPILSMRRTALGFHADRSAAKEMISRSWLLSAKLARKAGYWQTAYSAVLQATQANQPFAFIESTKLVKIGGEPLRALQELNSSMKVSGLGGPSGDGKGEGVIDLTGEEQSDETKQMKAKALVLRARWMNDSDRYENNTILKVFQDATGLYQKWESGWFHLGQFQDECFKVLSPTDQANRGTRMNLQTVRCYGKAMKHGSKYIYQTVPRLLTLWLDMGEDPEISKHEIFTRVNKEVAKAMIAVPMYKWFTAFPQIVSRVGHTNQNVYAILAKLIQSVISEYPKQALWLFTSVVKSTKQTRRERGMAILEKLKATSKSDVAALINASINMTEALLALCDLNIRDDKKMLSIAKDIPRLQRLMPSALIVPLQESLTASLPPTSSADATYQPFPVDAPTFAKFFDEIEIMRSLAKPRKITIQGSNGQVYMFLGKPKDDLRKDARLMDFNAIINKLLKSNSESRRRQLHIRTYGVVTLNEECGFIQWVPNTIPFRPVLLKGYEDKGIKSWSPELSVTFQKIKDANDKDAARMFVNDVLARCPPVFHEWFIETFPEPSAWLSSRLAYSRTAAVMSMVGFILGLGDRHCENILLDVITGDVVHVDFNCLFEKGKTLETPERVPFRLTQNLVDGLGITGYEGFFRVACEVTMQLLRDNKDTLMSVLDAFVHDPLVEWEDEKRKIEREAQRRNAVRASIDLRKLAKNSLNPIEKKLKGIYSTGREKTEREIPTSSLVQILIQEATDDANLAKMYPGWAPMH